MKYALTPRQKQVFDYIKANRNEPPSYEDIKDALGFSSRGSVADVIRRIVSRGWLEDPKGRARYWRFL